MTSQENAGPWMEAGREAGLVLSAQQGDRDSYLELVEHYAQPLHSLAHALTRHPDDALELTRETLVYGWKNIRHLPVGRPFCPWLTRAARNLSIAIRRRRVSLGEAPQYGPSRERVFLAAMSDLSVDDQLLLGLRITSRLSYTDIGAALEVPARTAMARVATARERLRSRISTRAREAA